MKEITVISGKGGTGKTTVTAALASLGKNMVLSDNDVDAADLHLILKPVVLETHCFEGSWLASINPDQCINCGICSDHCRFEAISLDDHGVRRVHPFKCEGCRLCERVCPSEAISSTRSTNNSWYVSDTRMGKMTHAMMGPGEENSGKLVTQVRTKAREIAKELKADIILNDGPPGTGCPAIASITGTDRVLLVMEPSKSSLHDAQRVIELVKQFEIPIFVIINKWDINAEMTKQIEKYLELNSIPLLGKLPFQELFVEAMIKGQTIVEFDPGSDISKTLSSAWKELTA